MALPRSAGGKVTTSQSAAWKMSSKPNRQLTTLCLGPVAMVPGIARAI